ncbi:MAG: imelysin family protein [Endozoicomonas sp.]
MFREPKVIVSVILCSLFLAGCGVNPEDKRPPLDALLEDVIRPEYAQLLESAEQFRQKSEAFCAEPDEPNFNGLRDSWRDAMFDWQGTEAVSQLYLEENMENWRFQFWPDRKNLVGRKVETLLEQELPQDLRRESVIVQGLSALEYLLFDPNTGSRIYLVEAERCRLLLAVSKSFVDNSRELNSLWEASGNFSKRMLSVDPEKGLTAQVWVINSLHTLVARLIRELNLPLGKKRVNHYLAESWRSGQSLGNTRESLYSAIIMIDFILGRSSSSDAMIWRELASTIESARLSLEQAPLSFAEAVKGDGLQKVVAIREQLSDLQRQIQGSAAQLDVALGFNASDGD